MNEQDQHYQDEHEQDGRKPDMVTDTPGADTPQATGAAAAWPEWLPLPAPDEPLRIVFTGEPVDEVVLLGNTITIEVVEAPNPGFADQMVDGDEGAWAADTATRRLVRFDANYKSTRPGPHPVDLTRQTAAALAAAVLLAVEETFHYSRVGSLRAAEALALLAALEEVDTALLDLRSHALSDLTHAPGRAAGSDPTSSTAQEPPT